jgi:molybdate-binding protein
LTLATRPGCRALTGTATCGCAGLRLAFVPLTSEQFDPVIPAAAGRSREVRGLRKVLCSPWLINQLASLPGYDPSHCGEDVTQRGRRGPWRPEMCACQA